MTLQPQEVQHDDARREVWPGPKYPDARSAVDGYLHTAQHSRCRLDRGTGRKDDLSFFRTRDGRCCRGCMGR